jgi:hypothetical protein
MRPLIMSILIFVSNVSLGQFALISDKDGYANIRTSAQPGSKITDTLHNGHLVYCYETDGNWSYIDFSRKKMDNTGYVYHNRLKFTSVYEKIPRLAGPNGTFGKDSLNVVITLQPFIRSKHRITYQKGSKTVVQFIDAKQYWGDDGEVPKIGYQSIHIHFGDREIILPETAFEDLYEPTLRTTEVYFDRQNDILYIQADNSDGAGAYSVIWRIEKGVYLDRFVDVGL